MTHRHRKLRIHFPSLETRKPRVSLGLLLVLALGLGLAAFAPPTQAQDREAPYWASLRADRVNMRVGPSADYPVAWVYRRKGLPVKVVRIKDGWRLVRDPDGEQGWIVARLLNPERSAMVTGKTLAEMRAEPSAQAPLRYRLEPGVIGKLGECERGWCMLDVRGHKGWVLARRLWGAGEA